MITTTKGLLPEQMLNKQEYVEVINGNCVAATEYWLGPELVHRSIHVTLKPLELTGEQATI